MQNWMKRSLLVLTVFGACWIVAVWYWRSTTRMPDTGDLALAMLVMPLVLLSAVWLANKSFNTAPVALARADGANEVPADAVGHAAANAAAAGSTQPQWQSLGVAGTALRMPHGDSAAELAAAIADGEARLDLDPQLTDIQGFPLLAGRVAGVDTAPLEDWLAGLEAAIHRPPAHHLRAMALSGDVASTLAARARSYGQDGVLPALRLLPLAPRDWPAESHQLAARWLVHCVAEAGWPLDRIANRPLPSGAQSSPLAALRGLASAAGDAAAPALAMLVGFESSVDQDAVEQMALSGKLYGPRNPNGRMPSEGAAGLLLQAAREGQDDAPCLLALSDAEAGQQPRLDELAAKALAQAGGQQAAYVAADTDHRVAAVSELMQCVEAHMPALDTNTALACVGTACGDTGACGAIAAIALAHQYAAQGDGMALALSNGDPSQRFALLVGPLPAPASSAPTLS